MNANERKSEPTFVPIRDRKSTRLNSSHSQISYAVFCLKKKTSLNSPGYVDLAVSLARIESDTSERPEDVLHDYFSISNSCFNGASMPAPTITTAKTRD